MAEGYLHLNGHNYQLSPRYLADDGTALEQLKSKVDELVRGLAIDPLSVHVVLRGDDTELLVAPSGVQCVALGVTVY
jgi:hypothetical protein